MDRGLWYDWAFRFLGLSCYHEAFGARSRMERFFRTLKRRTKAFANNVGGIPALSSMGGGLI